MNLHQALLKIKAEPDTSVGICQNLHDLGYYLRGESLYHLYRHWPEYSGNPTFPVPAPADFHRAEYDRRRAADDAYFQLTLWKGEYGAARRRLLDYLIERTKDENQA